MTPSVSGSAQAAVDAERVTHYNDRMAQPRSVLYSLGKLLEGIGLVVVLAGVLMSINLGLDEQLGAD